MKILKTNIDDCIIIEPDIFCDNRGFFLETFNYQRYAEVLNIPKNFVQDNHSTSAKNVLRGLHYQKNKPQGKLVRVVAGEVFDVAVDLRKESSTFGEYTSVILSESNNRQLWIPPGFAHGFLVLSDIAHFEYKCTDYYDPSDERCLLWNDPKLKIEWPCSRPLLSKKDSLGKPLTKHLTEI